MIEIRSNDGTVDIMQMKGTEKRIVFDLGAAVHKVMLLVANNDAKSAEEVFIKYGTLARELTEYIEMTVKRIDELGK